MTESIEKLDPSRALIVDDDANMIKTLSDLLGDEGFDVTGCQRGRDALGHLTSRSYDVAIVDNFLPDMRGTELLERINALTRPCPVVMYTGHGSLDSAKAAVNLGAFAYIEKLGDPGELLRYVHLAARTHLQRHTADLRATVAESTASLNRVRARFDTLANIAPVGIFHTDAEGNCRYINDQFSRIAGLDADAAMGSGWQRAVHADDRDDVLGAWDLMLRSQLLFHREFRFVDASGRTTWVIGRAAPQTDRNGRVLGHVGTITDITERRLAEERTRASLAEKEVLLKEIHHRVKNNLQVVSSLLHLQAKSVPDEQSRRHFEESQHRIRSMALIHEQLYQSRNLRRVDFAGYIKELTAHLHVSYGPRAQKVRLLVSIDDLHLGIDVAIPCGLIINELVSNALQHAFGDGGGVIRIELESGSGNELVLCVSDDGAGLPAHVELDNGSTLGLKLVNMLSRQLLGSVEIDRGRGTTFRLRFPER